VRLSIVILRYKARAAIAAIVATVRVSSYPDPEIVIVGDCSIGGTRELSGEKTPSWSPAIDHDVNQGQEGLDELASPPRLVPSSLCRRPPWNMIDPNVLGSCS
jgi:hypothetical protein